MNHLIIVCLILSAGICSVLAEQDSIQYETVEGKTVLINTSEKSLFESKIHDHLSIFQKLHKDSILFDKKRY